SCLRGLQERRRQHRKLTLRRSQLGRGRRNTCVKHQTKRNLERLEGFGSCKVQLSHLGAPFSSLPATEAELESRIATWTMWRQGWLWSKVRRWTVARK